MVGEGHDGGKGVSGINNLRRWKQQLSTPPIKTVNSNGHPGVGTKSITTGKMDALLFQQVINEVTQFVCNLARNSRGYDNCESPTP